jgi:hypothetical protein
MMTSSVVLAVTLALTRVVAVNTEVPCVTEQQIVRALDDVGGVLDMERVEVSVTPATAPGAGYVLTVRADLLNRPLLERTTIIQTHECKDVADLVAFLVEHHRRTKAAAGQLPAASGPSTSSVLPKADDLVRDGLAPARSNPHIDPTPISDSWSACDGPPSGGCLGIRPSVGAGPTTLGAHLQVDVSARLFDRITIGGLAFVEEHASDLASDRRTFVGIGSRASLAPYLPDLVNRAIDVTAAGHVGVASRYSKGTVLETDGCNGPTADAKGVMRELTLWMPGMQAALRARYGYVFAELGLWGNIPYAIEPGPAIVEVAVLPAAYVVVGFAPFG